MSYSDARKERLTLLVAKESLDGFSPPAFIVGALNTEFLAQLSEEDEERVKNEMKDAWTGERDAYHWREVECEVPAEKLEELFRTPLIEIEL